MADTITVRLGNEDVEAEVVPVERSQEEWSQYILADGTVIRLKPVALRVARVPDRYDAEGNEIFVVRSHNVVVVDSPEEKKRK